MTGSRHKLRAMNARVLMSGKDYDQFYEKVREEWAETDPYFKDREGWMNFLSEKTDEFFSKIEMKEDEALTRLKKILEMDWLKILASIVPRHTNVKLCELIYKKILLEAKGFTSDARDEFKENIELLGLIVLAHTKFETGKASSINMEMFYPYMTEHEHLNYKLGQFATPKTVARAMVKMLLPDDEEKLAEKCIRILDPCCGTGTFMVATAKHYYEHLGYCNFVFWNIDIDKRMMIYTVMNAILYRIPAIVIHGNALSDEYWEAWEVLPIPGTCLWRQIPKEHLEELKVEPNIRPEAEAPPEDQEITLE